MSDMLRGCCTRIEQGTRSQRLQSAEQDGQREVPGQSRLLALPGEDYKCRTRVGAFDMCMHVPSGHRQMARQVGRLPPPCSLLLTYIDPPAGHEPCMREVQSPITTTGGNKWGSNERGTGGGRGGGVPKYPVAERGAGERGGRVRGLVQGAVSRRWSASRPSGRRGRVLLVCHCLWLLRGSLVSRRILQLLLKLLQAGQQAVWVDSHQKVHCNIA